jgi:hypothetical protein
MTCQPLSQQNWTLAFFINSFINYPGLIDDWYRVAHLQSPESYIDSHSALAGAPVPCNSPTTDLIQNPKMLLDLPPEIINLITDHLSLPPKNSRRISESCPHFSHDQNQDRLALYDASETSTDFEADVLRFAMAHPYIASCMENSGQQFEVDTTVIDGLGVVPRVPEQFRGIVKYVPDAVVSMRKG